MAFQSLPPELILQIAYYLVHQSYDPDLGQWIERFDVLLNRNLIIWSPSIAPGRPVLDVLALSSVNTRLQALLLPEFVRHAVDTTFEGGSGALHHWIMRRGRVSVFQALLDAGPDVEVEDRTGFTPLLLAVRCGDEGVAYVRLLLAAGACVGPRAICLAQGVRMVRLLLTEGGADVDSVDLVGRSAIHNAAERGDEKVLQVLVEYGASVGRRGNSETPVELAVKTGKAGALGVLLEAGAEAEDTALRVAAKAGDAECTRLLVQKGARVNKYSFGLWGETPLQIATGLEDEEKALGTVEAMADTSTEPPDFSGQNSKHPAAVVVAAKRGHARLLAWILERDCKARKVYAKAALAGEVRALRYGVAVGKKKGKWCEYTEIVPARKRYIWKASVSYPEVIKIG